jgi:acetolactate synthase I/II/III large subunit
VGRARSAGCPVSIGVSGPMLPDPAACAEVARRLSQAKRPLVVAGNGARNAAPELRSLAERLAIPVVTTPHAKGVFPDSHPLCLGGIGFGGHPSALEYLESRPDVVVIVGSQLGDFATNGWSLPLSGSTATIQIDREALLIGRNYPVTLGIVADAKAALGAVLEALPTDVAIPQRATSGGIRRYSSDDDGPADVLLPPGRVIRALQRAFPKAFWTSDIGEHCAYALHYLEIDEPEAFRTLLGLGSMGTGIGLAIGARHAQRERPVIGICGDGGFAMHAGDVLTCVEHGIDVILVVLNDGRWNMVNHGFKSVFGRMPKEMPSHIADLGAVAREFGAIGVSVRTPEDLHPTRLRALTEAGRPVILDVRINPDLPLSTRSRSGSLQGLSQGAAL